MAKKGDLSINIIIIAAIALLVLVIISVIFTGRIAIFNIGISDCAKIKGKCDMGLTCDPGYEQDPARNCYVGKEIDKTNACCVSVGIEQQQ